MEDYKKACRLALTDLLAYYGGNKTQMAVATGVTRNAVSFWFTRGKIGRGTAMVVHKDPTIPFTREQLRPDIKVWSVYKQP